MLVRQINIVQSCYKININYNYILIVVTNQLLFQIIYFHFKMDNWNSHLKIM